MNTKRKTIFLDRDGVINELIDRGEKFLVKGKKVQFTAPFSYSEFKLKNGVKEALEKAGDLGYLRIIVTNQPDVKYGLLPEEEYNHIMEETRKLPVDDVFVCLHTRDDNCSCKKPKTGMFSDADKKWAVDFESSYIVGDLETDILAGDALGLKTILIKAPYNDGVKADFKVDDLREAIELIEEGKG
jgi:D-glycero-D-manno-heptose 1,7-bisphosphate phosphatase